MYIIYIYNENLVSISNNKKYCNHFQLDGQELDYLSTHQMLYSPYLYRDANLNLSISFWGSLDDGVELMFVAERVSVRIDRTLGRA
jgi:hypothetical protein